MRLLRRDRSVGASSGFGPAPAVNVATALLLGAGVLFCGLPSAAGRERTPVALSIDDCAAVEPAQVRHLLSLELGGPLSEADPPAQTTRATVTCPHSAEPTSSEQTPLAGAPPEAPPPTPAPAHASGYLVELRVDDAVTGKSLWRNIELKQADPAVRARLLALALAELLFAGWAELLVTPEPAVPAAAPTASAAARQATSVQLARKLSQALPPLGVQFSALGAVWAQLAAPAVAFGGGVRLTGDHLYHLGWDADVLLHHGETATALGTVTRDLLSTRATLLFHHQVPYLTLRGGVGGRLGAARLAGSAMNATTAQGSALWGPWGGPLLALGLSVAAARVRLDLSAEAGYNISPVVGLVGGVRAVTVEGPWFGVQLGLGGLVP